MIDRKSRDELAELLRHLASGQITNDDFEDSLPGSDDDAIYEIFACGAWFLYDDIRKYKLKGKDSLKDESKSVVASRILFLKTDLEYEWHVRTGFKEFFIRLLSGFTFGALNFIRCQNDRKGDKNYWLFFRKIDFEKAKENVRVLG